MDISNKKFKIPRNTFNRECVELIWRKSHVFTWVYVEYKNKKQKQKQTKKMNKPNQTKN